MKRTPLKRKKSPNGFPEETRMAARQRSGGVCEANSRACTGTASAFHHRKLRRHRDQSLANCLHVCNPCHRQIHDVMGEAAYLMGWLVHAWDDPAEIPVKRGGGP